MVSSDPRLTLNSVPAKGTNENQSTDRPCIVYLDQNKWIELARAMYRNNQSGSRGTTAVRILEAATSGRAVFPLSSVHYLETSRISNPGRRSRLGSVMWQVSRGTTLVAYRNIVAHECEVALSTICQFVPHPDPLELLGFGAAHAFGRELSHRLPKWAIPLFEESVLTGRGPNQTTMPPWRCDEYRTNFASHLGELQSIRDDMPRGQWDDALRAIVMMDIARPLSTVFDRHGKNSDLLSDDIDTARRFLDMMPTRRLELHLHRQILKNPTLQPRKTDLEDWGGLGPAAQYCDVVVCEKHFCDLVQRDKFQCGATILTKLELLPRLW